MKITNQTAAHADATGSAPTVGKTRRPRRMAREPGAGHEPSRAEAAPEQEVAPRGESKIARVIALLQREEGATLEELVQATNWLRSIPANRARRGWSRTSTRSMPSARPVPPMC